MTGQRAGLLKKRTDIQYAEDDGDVREGADTGGEQREEGPGGAGLRLRLLARAAHRGADREAGPAAIQGHLPRSYLQARRGLPGGLHQPQVRREHQAFLARTQERGFRQCPQW